jgi:hypothetical protein
MSDITLYGDLIKVEPLPDGAIRVHGVASTGARDGAGEVVAPDALRAALPAYMAFPAVREMHQPKAAGATLHAEVDEAGETRIVAVVVDPTAVQKVKAGVYKGLSIGGRVLERDGADPSRITAIRLDEISLVDRPCNPDAVIDLWKAAAPPSNEAVRAEAERMARAAGKPGRRNDYVAAARAKLSTLESSPASFPLEGGRTEVGGGATAVEADGAGGGAASRALPQASGPHPHPNPSPIEGEGLQLAASPSLQRPTRAFVLSALAGSPCASAASHGSRLPGSSRT